MAFTANPQTRDLEFQRFDSVRFLMFKDGIPRSTGNFLEIMTRVLLVWILSMWTGRAIIISSSSSSSSSIVKDNDNNDNNDDKEHNDDSNICLAV